MNSEQRKALQKKILKRYELYKFQQSRLKRLLKDPLRSIPLYIMNILGKIHPYKVSYTTLWNDHMHFYIPEGYAIYYYGFFEANLTNFFINCLKRGDIFFDVGAHVGYYSLLASTLVEDTGHVYSFEPTPRTFKTLQENLSSKKNCTPKHVAVLSTETTIDFYDYGLKYSAFNSSEPRNTKDTPFLPPPEHVQVQTISLDTLTTNNHISPTIIKIDAEGAEYIILQSMKNILSTIQPVITIEVAGGIEWKENCHKSIQFLTSYGYQLYEIDVTGFLHTHIEKDSYTYDNLVAIHPSKLVRFSKFIVK